MYERVLCEVYDIYTSFLTINEILNVSVLNTEINRVSDHGFIMYLESRNIFKIKNKKSQPVEKDENRKNIKSILSILSEKSHISSVHFSLRAEQPHEMFLFRPCVVSISHKYCIFRSIEMPFIVKDRTLFKITIPLEYIKCWQGSEKTFQLILIPGIRLRNVNKPVRNVHIYDKTGEIELQFISKCNLKKFLVDGDLGFKLNYCMEKVQ